MSDDTKDNAKILGDHAGVVLPNEAGAGMAIDFGDFVVGIYHSALVGLGKLPNPETDSLVKDLDYARHNIELLRLLQRKTRGNLDEEEAKLLTGLIHELQIAFVEAAG